MDSNNSHLFNYIIVAIDNVSRKVLFASGFEHPVSEIDFSNLRTMIDRNPPQFNIHAPYTLVMADMELAATIKYGPHFLRVTENRQ